MVPAASGSKTRFTRISTAMRFFFLVAAGWLWLGIWLTGFATIHWIIYVPAVFFLFAATTGICPGLIISNALFPRNMEP